MTRLEFLLGEGDRRDTVTVEAADIGHTFSGDITSHPVEVGADISDHFRPAPRRFSVSGFISEFPLGPTGNGSPQDTFDLLVSHWEKGTPFEIFTPLQSLGDCILKDLSISQTSALGGGFPVSMEIQQVITADVRQGDAVPVRRKKKGKKNGEGSKTETDAAAKEKGLISKGALAVADFIRPG